MGRRKKDGGEGFAILAIIIIGLVIFVNSPGMFTFTIIKEIFGLQLDIAQMWTFSTVFSVIIFSVFYYKLKNWNDTFLYYGILSISIIVIFLIAKFGFHSYFPEYVWYLFFNH